MVQNKFVESVKGYRISAYTTIDEVYDSIKQSMTKFKNQDVIGDKSELACKIILEEIFKIKWEEAEINPEPSQEWCIYVLKSHSKL